MDTLLAETFPHIGVEELSAVPVALLENHPNIPKQYISQLVEMPALFAKCPVAVRRHVWEAEPLQFTRMLVPLMRHEVDETERQLALLNLATIRAAPQQARIQSEVHQQRIR